MSMSVGRGYDVDLTRRRKDIVYAFNMYKQGCRCQRCGENHPACLMFYDPATKQKVSITYARRHWRDGDYAFDQLRNCECYCSNCFAKLFERPDTKASGLKAWLENYKREQGCVKCGARDPLCLEFHHIDPSVKETNISNCKTMAKALKEIEKCEIQCLNCHDQLHWEDEKFA